MVCIYVCMCVYVYVSIVCSCSLCGDRVSAGVTGFPLLRVQIAKTAQCPPLPTLCRPVKLHSRSERFCEWDTRLHKYVDCFFIPKATFGTLYLLVYISNMFYKYNLFMFDARSVRKIMKNRIKILNYIISTCKHKKNLKYNIFSVLLFTFHIHNNFNLLFLSIPN